MKLQFFAIPAKWPEDAQQMLNAFCAQHRVTALEKHFVEDFVIYAQLRNLRKSLSEQEGIPAYALFTNEQLAEMVTRRVRSETEMAKIEGIGKSRLEKYGSAFVQALKTSLPEQQENNDAPPAH